MINKCFIAFDNRNELWHIIYECDIDTIIKE